jgi:ribosome-associated heat shock protein Hsp15
MSEPGQRIDKWLWVARFFKTRAVAAALCEAKRVRVSGRVVDKAHSLVRVGDVLTFPFGNTIMVARVDALAERRGPASAARLLYRDLTGPGERPAPDADPASAPQAEE